MGYTTCVLHEILVTYLFSSLKVRMTEATVKRLKFGCTLCPASRIVSPWLMTWSTKVALISFESVCLLWPWTPLPALPLPLTLPPLLFSTSLFLFLSLQCLPLFSQKGSHLWSFHSAYILIEVLTINHWGVWPDGTCNWPISSCSVILNGSVWNGKHVTLFQIVVCYAENRVQCV